MTNINNIGTQIPVEVAKGGLGGSSITPYAILCGGTTSTAPIQSVASLGSVGDVLTSNGANNLPTFQTSSGGGAVVQQVRTSTGSFFSITGVIPLDDTIPQKTEGDEILTLTITPTDANHILVIDAVMEGSLLVSNAADSIVLSMALFRDSESDAKAAAYIVNFGFILGAASFLESATGTIMFSEVAGSTAATTYKIRCGVNGPTPGDINGQSNARLYGGTCLSSLRITEYTA